MSEPSAAISDPASRLILIVDDDDDMLDLLSLQLSEHASTRTASSGAEALRLARERRPDLIILDVQMPDLDGVATCELLRAEPQIADVPIIFVTARRDIKTVVASFQAGGDDFITKPIHRDELLRRVHAQLAK